MFLLDAEAVPDQDPLSDDIMLTIEYQAPDSGQARIEEYAFALGQSPASPSLNKAFLASLFARELQKLAERPVPSVYGRSPETWDDPEALQTCLDVRARLEKLAQPLTGDPEAHRVRVLWDTYCRRFKLGSAPTAAAPNAATPNSATSGPSTRSRGATSPSGAPQAAPTSAAASPSSAPSSASTRARHNEFAPRK